MNSAMLEKNAFPTWDIKQHMQLARPSLAPACMSTSSRNYQLRAIHRTTRCAPSKVGCCASDDTQWGILHVRHSSSGLHNMYDCWGWRRRTALHLVAAALASATLILTRADVLASNHPNSISRPSAIPTCFGMLVCASGSVHSTSAPASSLSFLGAALTLFVAGFASPSSQATVRGFPLIALLKPSMQALQHSCNALSSQHIFPRPTVEIPP
mmetsp:Transcript_11823/g.26842  ORF Transcript_11823/g.26842 Transcript_11823/m.26842 type:complete len:212 (+) Transcript_11823:208-843(+)